MERIRADRPTRNCPGFGEATPRTKLRSSDYFSVRAVWRWRGRSVFFPPHILYAPAFSSIPKAPDSAQSAGNRKNDLVHHGRHGIAGSVGRRTVSNSQERSSKRATRFLLFVVALHASLCSTGGREFWHGLGSLECRGNDYEKGAKNQSTLRRMP